MAGGHGPCRDSLHWHAVNTMELLVKLNPHNPYFLLRTEMQPIRQLRKLPFHLPSKAWHHEDPDQEPSGLEEVLWDTLAALTCPVSPGKSWATE